MRYSLRTLLILTILGPPALAWAWPMTRFAYESWLWRNAIAAAKQIKPYAGGLINERPAKPASLFTDGGGVMSFIDDPALWSREFEKASPDEN